MRSKDCFLDIICRLMSIGQKLSRNNRVTYLRLNKKKKISNKNYYTMVQRKGINFEGQNVYIGIDVHLKTWQVTIITESGYKNKFSQSSSAHALFENLKKHYPGGNYHAV